MTNRSFIHYLIVASLFLISCGKSNSSFQVKGSIQNLPTQTIFLEEMGVAGDVIVDSTKADKEGNFTLQAKNEEATLYRIKFSDNAFIIFSTADKDISIKAEWPNIENYTISGAPEAIEIKNFITRIREDYIRNFNTLYLVLDTAKARQDVAMTEKVTADINQLSASLTSFVESYTDTTHYVPNAYFAMNMLNFNAEKAFFTALSSNMDYDTGVSGGGRRLMVGDPRVCRSRGVFAGRCHDWHSHECQCVFLDHSRAAQNGEGDGRWRAGRPHPRQTR